MSISGNMVGMYSTIGKTFILEDEEGNELTGVITEQMTILDVTDRDVRCGVVYAGDEGIRTGIQEFPQYTYALINTSGLCSEVCGTSKSYDGIEGYIAILYYDTNYIGKYYNTNNKQWYLDASFSTKFVSE